MKKKLILLLAFIIVIGATLTGCSKKESNTKASAAEKYLETLRFALASNTNVLTGVFGIAQSKGYLDEELAAVGYKLEVLGFAQAGPAVNEAFVSGDIDVAAYGDFPSVVIKSKGIGVSLIGSYETSSSMTIAVAEGSDIQSVKDLEGKKVLVGIGTVLEQYWDRVVEEYGLDESKIEVINDPANANSIFLAGDADAYVTVDLFVEKIRSQYPVRVIDSTKESHPEWGYQGVIAARDDFATAHPDVLTALFKAYLRAYKDATKDSELIPQSFVQESFPIELAKAVYGSVPIENFDGDLAQENIDKISALNEFLVNKKLTTTSIDVNSFINKTYYEDAKKALGE